MKKWMAVGALALLVGLATGCSKESSGEKIATGEASAPAQESVDEKLRKAFQPLDDMPVPADNPMTAEKVELGKLLYFDTRLSGNNQISCQTCHVPAQGYGDGLKKFKTFDGGEGPRNSPTVLNAGYYHENFWDGRAKSLEEQALGPIQSEKEMNQKLDELIVELNGVQRYVTDFKTVFPEEGLTAGTIAKAIAAFERTLVVKNTKFDQYLNGDDAALSADAKRGAEVFLGKGSCATCHAGKLLSDGGYANIGLKGGDAGRYEVTKKEEDKGKIRTPGLRGVAFTAPYFHDGSAATLEDVIKFYNRGGDDVPNKDVRIKPLGLTDQEIADLVAFLKSMGGEPPLVMAPTLP